MAMSLLQLVQTIKVIRVRGSSTMNTEDVLFLLRKDKVRFQFEAFKINKSNCYFIGQTRKDTEVFAPQRCV